MSLHTAEYLSLCSNLAAGSVAFKVEVGAVVARGFADLGFEEFLVLPGNRLLSLYSGELTKDADLKDSGLFLVPSLDDMQAALVELGYDIVLVEFRDQRDWFLRLKHYSRNVLYEVGASRLEEAFLRALLKVGIE